MRVHTTKMRVHERTLPERVMLNVSDVHSSMHSHRHTASAEEDFGDRERFFVIYGFECGLPGMLVSAGPRNLQNLHRMSCHNFCCALAGGLMTLSFSWSEVLTSARVGWCRRSWSGLPVAGESFAAQPLALMFV